MISKNEIYTKLKQKVNDNKVYFTQNYEIVPKSFPCLYFRTSHSPVRRNQNLQLTDRQMRMVIYIELYGQDLDGLSVKVEQAMREMKFLEDLNETIPNYDPSVERLSLRFQRVITDSDTL